MTASAEGEVAVALARWAVDRRVGDFAGPRPTLPPSFRRSGAAFVSLYTHPGGDLRGCIGYPSPVLPREEAVERAPQAACLDPRFPPLTPAEADGIVVEVSLLTAPEVLRAASPRDYLRAVLPGVHDLAVAYGPQRGLLLPQVAADEGWAPDEFLSHACLKAGLLPDAWFEPGVRIATFQAEVFAESRPRGAVVRRRLPPVHDGH